MASTWALMVGSMLMALSPATCFVPPILLHTPISARQPRETCCFLSSIHSNLPGGTGGMQGAIVTKSGISILAQRELLYSIGVS